MRNYWLKIALSAVGIFAVGMVVITGFKSLKHSVTNTINSSDPIPIPLIGLVPFRLDSQRLGSLSKVEFLRSDPEHVSGVRVFVKLADSVSPDVLRKCVLALDNVDNIGENTTFRCNVTDQAGLQPFGMVVLRGSGDSLPLLLPDRAVADLRETSIHLDRNGLQVTSASDRRRAAWAERVGPLRERLSAAVDARSDSVDHLRDMADALEDSASEANAAERRTYQRRADSARTAMRAVMDRMKANEAQLQALDSMDPLTQAQLDSLRQLGPRMRDSIRAEVAKQLEQVQIELQQVQAEAQARTQVGAPASSTPAPRARGTGAAAAVEAPAPPKPPAPTSRP